MRLIYHPEAEAEISEAAMFYEQRMAGLGESFLRELRTVIGEIEKQPEWSPIVDDDIRCRSLGRFPYSIYYRFSGDELRILVVKHHGRHPDYWRSRSGK